MTLHGNLEVHSSFLVQPWWYPHWIFLFQVIISSCRNVLKQAATTEQIHFGARWDGSTGWCRIHGNPQQISGCRTTIDEY